ncbi:hypothetical protein HD806DRAFT_463937 [Xylariaceae sp. AK1471]|nr:hypothetical protein HD806DRAFT_463937 [Xylariaceae sp. AK1471]
MDARPYRPPRHLPSLGDENHVNAIGKTLHQRHKSTGNLLNMAATGNFNAAAKRTALADRNVASRDVGDALCDTKSGTTQNNTASAMVASKAQENRIQANPKNVLKKGFFQPAQRPSKTVAPSVSMSQLRSIANDTHGPRKALARASVSTFVLKDPQQEEFNPAPAGPARAAPENWPVIQASQTKPSTTLNTNTKQEPLVDSTSLEPETWQLEQCQLQDQQQPSHYSKYEEVQHQKPNYAFTLPSILNPVGEEAPSHNSPRPDDDVTEPLYVDAVEDLTQEQIQFLTNAPAQFMTVAPQPEPLPVRPLPESLIPTHINPPRTSSARPEVNPIDCHSDSAPPGLVGDQLYLSDYDDEDDYCYDDRGYTTAHSYRSRSDNTTGGATTIMFPPKLTKKGLAEIEAAKQIVDSRRTSEEIQEDAWDVSMVAEYGDDIFRYMKEQEMNLLPSPHYMDIQTEIQWSMRSVLMDWVVQVHTRFGLLPETLFLTVNYIDRFLSYKVVSLGKLQLVGATAIFIAAKYEEINCPSVQEIVYMVDGGYTAEEILKAERFMLSMLDFELGWPGPMSFLRRISKADDYDLEARTLAKYFLEVVIMDERFVASPPSYIAAGAHCLSRLILRKGEWTPSHIHYSGYTYQQLKPLVAMLLDCCRHARKHHSAVFEKYSDKRYRCASSYVGEEIMRGYALPFEQRISMPLAVDFFGDEATRASYTGSQALKMPIPT